MEVTNFVSQHEGIDVFHSEERGERPSHADHARTDRLRLCRGQVGEPWGMALSFDDEVAKVRRAGPSRGIAWLT
jgi:hypothetical protein